MKNEEIDEECVWTRKKDIRRGEKSGIGRMKKEWKKGVEEEGKKLETTWQ